jgi:hypothetical protein
MMNLFQQNHHLIQKLLVIENYLKGMRKGMINLSLFTYFGLFNYQSFREGLRQTVTNIKAPANFYADQSTTYSYLRSYQKTSTSQGKR